jgi:two-component system CheB/CheR fusion protein
VIDQQATAKVVVGIGASAGGIEAMREMFGSLRLDGAAFVVVTHQPKDSFSYLPEVLQRFTVLAVDRAVSGSVLETNHIYVLPRSELFTLEVDRLVHHGHSTGPARNIDYFFSSLARERGDRAVGVVLSGADQDGTLGLEAIRQGGGSTFVQHPKSAQFARMPASAQASADYSLPPSALGECVMQLLLRQAHFD